MSSSPWSSRRPCCLTLRACSEPCLPRRTRCLSVARAFSAERVSAAAKPNPGPAFVDAFQRALSGCADEFRVAIASS